MSQLYNIYCDESCHLEHRVITENNRYMVLGGVTCLDSSKADVFKRIKSIKAENGLSHLSEMKWTKVSQPKIAAYRDMIHYFFDNNALAFRCIVIDKQQLNHDAYAQDHDQFSCQYWQPINDMHRTFWHLITHSASDGRDDEDREVDMRRCEQLCWIAHIIKNHNDPAIKCWKNKRGSNTHIVLWLEQENYMIVLAERNGYWLLKTAYPHGESTRKRNAKEALKNADPRNS